MKTKSIPLPPEIIHALEQQRESFRKKFGRDPLPHEPVLFDPDASEPRPMALDQIQTIMIAALENADIPPAIIHAYKKTGFLVTENNQHRLTKAELREWQEAIDEYYQQHDSSR
jgi:hypothetical protein